MKARTRSLVLLLASGWASAACDITAEKIRRWKTTERGPQKLSSALRDGEVQPALRREAAFALADIGEIPRLVGDLGALSAADRKAITDTLADRLLGQMERASAETTTRSQLQAKDALVSLRATLDGDTRARVDERLIKWLLEDWAPRSVGEHSGPKIVRAVGQAAAGWLIEGIDTHEGLAAVYAELVKAVGGPSDRDAAAAKLVSLARRQSAPTERIMEALGRLGSKVSRAFLLQQGTAGEGNARVLALQALALDPDPASVDSLATLAADRRQPLPVRGAAFQALEAIRDATTATAIAAIVRRDPHETVRYRAAEAMITCCQSQGAAKLLEALPPGYSYKQADVIDFLEKDLRGLGKPVVPILRDALASKGWITRLIAVRVLGDMGGEQDLPLIEGLVNDGTRLRGWGKAATIGSEARAAAQRLRARAGKPSAGR